MADTEFRGPDGPRNDIAGTLRNVQWSLWVQYAVVAAVILALTFILAIFEQYFPATRFRISYALVVGLAAFYFGAGPAILALALALVSFAYLYQSDAPSLLSLPHTADQWAGLASLAAGMLLAGFVGVAVRRLVQHAQDVRADLVESNEALRSEMTVRERAEEALERSESRFHTTFERAGIGMTVVDMKGFVLAANPAFAELTGYSLEELPGMHVQDYAYPEDLPHGNELLAEMIEGKRDSYTVEKRYVTKDGRIIWGRLTASIARNPAPEPPFIIGMIEDITQRVLAEQREREIEEGKLEFYRRTITAATNGKLVIADKSEIDSLSGTLAGEWNIDNSDNLPKARNEVREIAVSAGVDEDRAWQFATCAGEAITNAIKHAGGGNASLHHTTDGLLFIMSDHGPGIPDLTIPDVALRRSYSTVGTLGMGYKVMLSFGDRVYLATGPGGTTVAIEMKLKPQQSSLADISRVGLLGSD